MHDASQFRQQYGSFIHPVGQLVSVDSRMPKIQITNRFCTGFNIDPNGLFLTAGHCLTQGDTCSSLAYGHQTQNYRISFNNEYNQSTQFLYPIRAVVNSGLCVDAWSGNESIDYTLLQLDKDAATWGYLRPVIDTPPVNTAIYAVSHPNAQQKKISFGHVTNTYQQGLSTVIDHTAHIEPGSSGSPLSANLDNTACAVGINIRVSIDENKKTDHLHHYAVSMSTVANHSHHVRNASYSLNQHGLFSVRQQNQQQGGTVRIYDQQNYSPRSRQSGCCG